VQLIIIPITTKKIRFVSNNGAKFHIREFRVYNDNNRNFPDVLSKTADTDIPGLVNYARSEDVNITASGFFDKKKYPVERIADGQIHSSWVTQDDGVKTVEFKWKKEIVVGAIQFINGWQDSNGGWNGLVEDFKIQYLKGNEWVDISTLDVKKSVNFAETYNTFGLEWDEENIIYYFNGKEIRRLSNEFCYTEMPIYLSLAIIPWSGPVTDAIDGTSMKVDYVRYYTKK